MIYVTSLKLISPILLVYVSKTLIFHFHNNFAREKITEDDIKTVDQVLSYFLLLSNTDNISAHSGLTDCCRLLRNMCVQCTSTQDKLLPCIEKIKSVILSCTDLKRGIHKTKSENSSVLFRCIVQFIGNSIVGHPKNQQYVWDNFQNELRYVMIL